MDLVSTIVKLKNLKRLILSLILNQGYRYHKLRKAFSKFYHRHYELISNFNVRLKSLLHQGLSEPEFYGDLVYKFKKIRGMTDFSDQFRKTSNPKGNDAHLRAIIQSEKKWKYHFFRRLRAVYSVVRGPIWPNFKFIQALMYVIITCKYEKDPIKNNREKVATLFFSNYNIICCHGNQWSDLAEFRTHSSFYA